MPLVRARPSTQPHPAGRDSARTLCIMALFVALLVAVAGVAVRPVAAQCDGLQLNY